MTDSEKTQASISTIADLFEKTGVEDPKPEDLQLLRKALNADPQLAYRVGNLAETAALTLVDRITGTKSWKESTTANLQALRLDLKHETSSPVERLVIEQVVLCWLRMNLTEYKYTHLVEQGELTMPQADFWERRLSAVQRRYLRAIETLARVRKLVRATVQVNIAEQGSKQLNVAGDLKVERDV